MGETTDETTTDLPERRAGMRLDDEMQVGNMPEHAKDTKTPAFADQAIDRGGVVPVKVDMPEPVKAPDGLTEIARGTVPDVLDPAIEGDARDRRSETVLQEGVSYAEKDGDMREAPIEATQGFSAERLKARDEAKGKAAYPGNNADSGDKESNRVQEDVEKAEKASVKRGGKAVEDKSAKADADKAAKADAEKTS